METPGERYDPVGSTNELDTMAVDGNEHVYFKDLENDQELLSSSLQALTSHFAQVQFRLRQIISAPHEERINLIENLDEFASRGIPELKSYDDESECALAAINQQRHNQFKLINKLRMELSAASNFANEKGFDLQIENSDSFAKDEGNDDTVDMDLSCLKTQILNLDTLVTDLQYETINLKEITQAIVGYKNCEKIYKTYSSQGQSPGSVYQSHHHENDDIFSDSHEYYTASSISNKSQKIAFELPLTQAKISDGKSPKVGHWGNIRAKLEIDVQNIIAVITGMPSEPYQSKQSAGIISMLRKETTRIVRKELCGTLRALIEHGLHEIKYKMPFFGCCLRGTFNGRQIPFSRHAWDIILEYYKLNDGDQFYKKAINKLNETFQLAHPHATSTKDQLFKAIGDVINIRVRFSANSNSHNAYFKAFVSLGLNSNKLPQWLSLIFKCPDLIELNYSDESFVCQPVFREALHCLDLLSNYDFNLPVDTMADTFGGGINLFN